eukprot:m51a1_g13719 hypothetical protein (677) ;mRNA; r:103149-105416
MDKNKVKDRASEIISNIEASKEDKTALLRLLHTLESIPKVGPRAWDRQDQASLLHAFWEPLRRFYNNNPYIITRILEAVRAIRGDDLVAVLSRRENAEPLAHLLAMVAKANKDSAQIAQHVLGVFRTLCRSPVGASSLSQVKAVDITSELARSQATTKDGRATVLAAVDFLIDYADAGPTYKAELVKQGGFQLAVTQLERCTFAPESELAGGAASTLRLIEAIAASRESAQVLAQSAPRIEGLIAQAKKMHNDHDTVVLAAIKTAQQIKKTLEAAAPAGSSPTLTVKVQPLELLARQRASSDAPAVDRTVVLGDMQQRTRSRAPSVSLALSEAQRLPSPRMPVSPRSLQSSAGSDGQRTPRLADLPASEPMTLSPRAGAPSPRNTSPVIVVIPSSPRVVSPRSLSPVVAPAQAQKPVSKKPLAALRSSGKSRIVDDLPVGRLFFRAGGIADLYPYDYEEPSLHRAARDAGIPEADEIVETCLEFASTVQQFQRPDDFTDRDVAVIALMTVDLGPDLRESTPYRIVNRALVERSQTGLHRARGLLHMLLSALRKIPRRESPCLLYKGTTEIVSTDSVHYKKGNRVTWHTLTSTTSSHETARWFLTDDSGTCRGTVFHIRNAKGYSIRNFSLTQTFDEVLLEPESEFVVLNTLPAGPMMIVELDMQPSTDAIYADLRL